MYKTSLSSAHDLKSTIPLDRRLSAAHLTTDRQAIEGKAMILVLKRKTAACLSKDLDVASGSASLGSSRQGGGESTAKGLSQILEYQFPERQWLGDWDFFFGGGAYDVDDHA